MRTFPQFYYAAKLPTQYNWRIFSEFLKEVCYEIFDFLFFHESVSSGPQSFSCGAFWIFTQIRGDIHNFVFMASVVDTEDKLFTSD